jgi:DNA-binding CsgD family transcriptional regulator
LFGVDHAIVMRAGAATPYVGDGIDDSTLDAMAAFHEAPAADAPPRVRYADPSLEELQARRLAVPDPVFTRRGNEAAMGVRMEDTPMFDAVCKPIGLDDFCGIFSRSRYGDLMIFLAHGRKRLHSTRLGADAEPLLRVLVPVVHASAAMADALTTSAALPGHTVLQQRFGLTPRESEVALALAEGLSLRAIAASLAVSVSTARSHTEAVFRKLGVHRRSAVAVALLERGGGL